MEGLETEAREAKKCLWVNPTQPSTTYTTCPWKGETGYYDIVAVGKMNKDAAKHTAGYVAFWKGVQIDDR
jgi:uncharacterized protein (DUF427 family)